MGKPAKGGKKASRGKQAGSTAQPDEGGGGGGGGERRGTKGSAKQRRRAAREHHWAGDDLERELAPLGLRIKTMDADGNCFFRSVCDQLEGDGGDHMALRGRVMGFIEENEDDYKFFIEDDEPFDKYVRRMRKDGAWAGHLELQAASILLKSNLSVYQAGQPVWHIRNFPNDSPCLHLSYHDGMHYNSVRNADDHGSGPPEPLRVRSAADLAATDPAALAAAARAFGEPEVDRVVAGTGCADRERAARALQRCGGDPDQAIEALIEELANEEEGGGEGGGDGGGRAASDAAAAGVAAGGSETEQQGQQRQPQAAASRGEPSGAAALQQAAVAQQQQQQQQQLASAAVRLVLTPHPADPGRVCAALQPCEEQQQGQQGQQGASPSGAADGKQQRRAKGVKVSKGAKAAAAHVGRNTRCPCGSKQKYKSCCGRRRGDAAAGRGAAEPEGGAAAAAAAAQLQVLLI